MTMLFTWQQDGLESPATSLGTTTDADIQRRDDCADVQKERHGHVDAACRDAPELPLGSSRDNAGLPSQDRRSGHLRVRAHLAHPVLLWRSRPRSQRSGSCSALQSGESLFKFESLVACRRTCCNVASQRRSRPGPQQRRHFFHVVPRSNVSVYSDQ